MHDVKSAPELLVLGKYKTVIADAAYSSREMRKLIHSHKAKAVIANSKRHAIQYELDRNKYKERNQIERFFSKLKHFRGIATRYIKKGIYFLQSILFATFLICSKFDDTT